MSQKSLKSNAIWNLAYTGSNILIPLITAPYVTRVLGATNMGKVDFARSLIQWFVIFAAFGTTSYGIRAVSQVRNNKDKLGKIFSELFFINLFFSIIAFVSFLILIFGTPFILLERPLAIVMSFSIIFNTVNIDWLYQGIEEYSYITIRNLIIKIISTILIFVAINNSDDYILYGLISTLGLSLSGILNLLHSRKYVKITIKKLDFRNHLKPLRTFFLSLFIVNLYTNLDKTLLGILDIPSSVAFLTTAKIVTSMAGTVSTSIATVAMPRASYYLKEDFSKYKLLMQEVPKYMMFLTIPMVFGIAILAPEIMFILGGVEFEEASKLLAIIAVLVLFSTLSTFLQQQVMVPSSNERLGLISSIISSLISVVFNLLLIPKYSYIGAGIALVLAEFSAFLSRLLFTKIIGFNFIEFINASSIKYTCASIIMTIFIYIIKININIGIIGTVILIVIGFAIYILCLMLFREKIARLYSSMIIKKFIKK